MKRANRWSHPKAHSPEHHRLTYRLEHTNSSILTFTDREFRILDLGLLYQKIRRERLDHPFWRAFPKTKNPKLTSNWRHFAETLSVLEENGFPTTVFIVAQFDELATYPIKQKYPKPSMLPTPKAVDRMYAWLSKNKEKKLGDTAWTKDKLEQADVLDSKHKLRILLNGHKHIFHLLEDFPVLWEEIHPLVLLKEIQLEIEKGEVQIE